jgi:hypothetical protein
MSMEIHVLFRGKLPTKAALQTALRELGFPFSIKPVTGSLERQDGFMPMLLEREETGAEFDVFEGRDAVEEIGGKDVDPCFDRAANFRWGGSMHECASAVCAAAALAKLVDGVVFDDEEGKLLSIEQAIAAARQVFAEVPKPSAPTPRPRRPTLKRLLKPLLETRGDLVLLGRLLVIRPVRHLLRGAALHWMPKYSAFHVYHFVQPLFQGAGIKQDYVTFTVRTRDSEYEAMLLEGLAVDVFEVVGRHTRLEDFITAMKAKPYWADSLYLPILLSKGLSEAKAYLTTCEENGSPWRGMDEARALLDRGAEGVFACCRGKEAEAARRMKIESIWEASPFPAEQPSGGGTENASDPFFAPTPWPAYSTSWRQEHPQRPGDIRFASFWRYRGDTMLLTTPLTREEAEWRHRNYIVYMLAARLPQGQLLIVCPQSSDFPLRRPDGSLADGQPPPGRRYDLWIYDSSGRRVMVDFYEFDNDPGTLRLWFIEIRTADGARGIWSSRLDFEKGDKTIWDHRHGSSTVQQRPLSESDRTTYTFPVLPFGEYGPLWQCVELYLANEGFGSFA